MVLMQYGWNCVVSSAKHVQRIFLVSLVAVLLAGCVEHYLPWMVCPPRTY